MNSWKKILTFGTVTAALAAGVSALVASADSVTFSYNTKTLYSTPAHGMTGDFGTLHLTSTPKCAYPVAGVTDRLQKSIVGIWVTQDDDQSYEPLGKEVRSWWYGTEGTYRIQIEPFNNTETFASGDKYTWAVFSESCTFYTTKN